MAALFGRVQEDVDRIVVRFRLSNAERARMRVALSVGEEIASSPAASDRERLYRCGLAAFEDGLAFAAARGFLSDADFVRRGDAARAWTIPVFPLSGRDVVELGVDRGPLVGLLLRHVEREWIASGFREDAEGLRERLAAFLARHRQQQQQQQ
jgi:poly(A) polymerase